MDGHPPLVMGNEPELFENHGIDSRYTGPHEVAPTMSARYGTGGNNVPLITQNSVLPDDESDEPAYEETYCIAGNIIPTFSYLAGNFPKDKKRMQRCGRSRPDSLAHAGVSYLYSHSKKCKMFLSWCRFRLCRVLISPYAGLRCYRISACHDVFCCQRNPVNVYYTSERKKSQDGSQPAFQLKLSAIRILSKNIV